MKDGKCKGRALVVYGGFEEHKPGEMAEMVAAMLVSEGVEAVLTDDLSTLDSAAELERSFDMVVSCLNMVEIGKDRTRSLLSAVEKGLGFAACHGGAFDSDRGNLKMGWLAGAAFCGHPAGHESTFTVHLDREAVGNPLNALPVSSFTITDEQVVVLIDPAAKVLAWSEPVGEHAQYSSPEQRGRKIPVAWTKSWGRGRVFCCSLGHDPLVFANYPFARQLVQAGMLSVVRGWVA